MTGKSMMLVIYGPTASGKTNLALKLAKKYKGEIISADSRQVYRGLDIGTGKVDFASHVEKHTKYWIVNGVKIHGFDLVDPHHQFTVADFLKFASDTMIRINRTKVLPIIVGGTGFYIKALIEGIDTTGIPQDQKLRRQLEKLTVPDLFGKLKSIDPQRANSMNESDRANPRRLIRAIEIAQATSTSQKVTVNSQLPARQSFSDGGSDVNCLIIALTAPNPYLYQRADNWLQTRLNHGMIEEIRYLLNNKVDPKWLDNLGLEYRWLTRYLTGLIAQNQAIKRLRGDIHHFIRRQKTWFKHFPNAAVFNISQANWQQKLEKTARLWYTKTRWMTKT